MLMNIDALHDRLHLKLNNIIIIATTPHSHTLSRPMNTYLQKSKIKSPNIEYNEKRSVTRVKMNCSDPCEMTCTSWKFVTISLFFVFHLERIRELCVFIQFDGLQLE